MNPKDKNFKKLRDEWYAKLKAEGFQDIESGSLEYEYVISHPVSAQYQSLSKEESFSDRFEYYQASQEYYSLASGFLHEHEFKNKTEKEIWYLHSEGKSYREIAAKLRTKNLKLTKDTVNTVVSRLKSIMLTGLHK